MAQQVVGWQGRLVDGMIRRSVRKTFRNVYWLPPSQPVSEPAIFVPNHHGWHDGYVMYLALRKMALSKPFYDWIQEYDAFPLFGQIGGLPFPLDDPLRRTQTVRRTLRFLAEGRNLMLFAEGVLHRPPNLLPFGKGLELLATKTPRVTVIPVAIRYDHSIHERPEAFLSFGSPVQHGADLAARCRLEVAALLDHQAAMIHLEPDQFQILHPGTPDVNERMDMRQIPKWLRPS